MNSFGLRITVLGLAAWLATGTIVCETSARANPSTSDPVAPLAVRVDETNAPLLAKLVQLDAQARKTLAELDLPRGKRSPSQREINDVGRVAMMLTFAEHFALQLADRSEAAGFDYFVRARELGIVLKRVVADYKSGGGFRTDAIERELRAAHDAAARRLPELQARGKVEEQLEGVEQEYVQILAGLVRYGVWIDEATAGKFYRPFVTPLETVRAAASAQRQQRLQQELTQLAASTRPNFDEIPTQLSAAADSLKSESTAMWKGASLTGPAIVKRAVDEAQIVTLRAQRTRMLLLASRGSSTAVPAMVDDVTHTHTEFVEKTIAGIGGLLAADATRIAPQESRELYRQYLAALGSAALCFERRSVMSSWEPPLAALAEKDPALKQDVANYQRSTRELLRWRREVTEFEVNYRTKKHQDVHAAFFQSVRSASGATLLAPHALVQQTEVRSSTAAVLPHLAETLVGKQASVRDVLGLGAGKTIAPYQDRVYARATVPYSKALELQVDALRMMLLVTPTQGPLSLDAAIALAAAEDETYRAVGGTVREVTLEPLLIRMATVSDRSRGLLRLQPLPKEVQTSDLHKALLGRLDIDPEWVAHETFVVDLLERPTPTAAPPAAPLSQPVAQATE